MMCTRSAMWFTTCAAALSASRAAAVTVGELQNFSVDLGAWSQGREPIGEVGLTRVETGGPAGAGDAFMQIVSDSVGTQKNIIGFNLTPEWTGDYLAAGVTGLAMAVRNEGPAELRLRVALGTWFVPDGPGSWVASTNPVVVPAGGGWTNIHFPLAAAGMTIVQNAGGADYTSIMSGVAALRLLHASSANNRGTPITARLGVDNIRAVPEPGVVALVGVAILAVETARRRLTPVRRVG
jgi:hypothetical protein